MSGGNITVHFETISGAADDTSRVASSIDALLSDLSAQLTPLASQWDGEAQQSFLYQKHLWEAAAQDMHATLVRIAQVLASAHGGYTDTESSVTNMWA
jgi:6 kDa early secretory antigenic target